MVSSLRVLSLILSHVQRCDSPLTVPLQAPLPMGLPRQEYWSGWPLLSPGALPDPWMEAMSPALAGRFFNTEPPGPWDPVILGHKYS